MIFFLGLYLVVYGSVHLYFFLKFLRAFKPSRPLRRTLLLLLLFLFLSPLLVRLLERWGLEETGRVIAYLGYGWMALLFSFFVFSAAVDLLRIPSLRRARRNVFTKSARAFPFRTVFLLACAYSVAVYGWGYREALRIRTEHVTINTPKLPAGTRPIKIAQISDVHLGLIVREKRLERIMEVLRREQPDLLVSTGDLVDGRIAPIGPHWSEGPPMVKLLTELNPPLGKYAVTGNHELYAGLEQSLAFTASSGFRILRDEAVPVGNYLTLAGVDDVTAVQQEDSSPQVEARLLAPLDRRRFTLLLKHRPRVEQESRGLFDLQLSGHVHKGQIFPFNFIAWLSYRVRCGLTDLGDGSLLYTSRGTGTWGPPVRFLAPPEVTVIELAPPSPAPPPLRN
jgi:predicted MPP superfamily phosphohydrolase